MNNLHVSIIILNYNNYKDTKECIESVLKTRYKNKEIILVDNGSEEKYINLLEKDYQKNKMVRIIKNDENLGFAAGNNVGIKIALENKTDYILLLNNDTIVDNKSINILVDNFKNADSNVGILGPMIYHYKHPIKIQSLGGSFGLYTGNHSSIAENEKDVGQYKENFIVDYVSGACIFIKSNVFKEIGLLDEDYFFYVEEVDFCLRAKKNNILSMTIPQAKIWHKGSLTAKKNKLLYLIHYKNLFIFMIKHGKIKHWPLFMVVTFYKIIKDIIKYFFKK